MQPFKTFIAEDLVASAHKAIDSYKTRKLSGSYDVSHSDEAPKKNHAGKTSKPLKFSVKKSGTMPYHITHVKNALRNHGHSVESGEIHDKHFTVHVY